MKNEYTSLSNADSEKIKCLIDENRSGYVSQSELEKFEKNLRSCKNSSNKDFIDYCKSIKLIDSNYKVNESFLASIKAQYDAKDKIASPNSSFMSTPEQEFRELIRCMLKIFLKLRLLNRTLSEADKAFMKQKFLSSICEKQKAAELRLIGGIVSGAGNMASGSLQIVGAGASILGMAGSAIKLKNLKEVDNLQKEVQANLKGIADNTKKLGNITISGGIGQGNTSSAHDNVINKLETLKAKNLADNFELKTIVEANNKIMKSAEKWTKGGEIGQGILQGFGQFVKGGCEIAKAFMDKTASESEIRAQQAELLQMMFNKHWDASEQNFNKWLQDLGSLLQLMNEIESRSKQAQQAVAAAIA